jgi:hypothetical protein
LLKKKYFKEMTMKTVLEIETAVSKLPVKDFDEFWGWFEKFKEERWTKKFKNDVQMGKLDDLANEALADFNAGKCKNL